jgi:hypothetical protein
MRKTRRQPKKESDEIVAQPRLPPEVRGLLHRSCCHKLHRPP